MGIAYSSDPGQVRDLIKAVLERADVAKNREPQVGIDSFGDSGINFAIRFWVPTDQFHQLRMQVNNQLFDALNIAGIEIPYPQREVRVLGDALPAA